MQWSRRKVALAPHEIGGGGNFSPNGDRVNCRASDGLLAREIT